MELLFFILLIIFLFFAVLIPILALIEVIGNEFTGNNKLIWVLVILFFPFFGAVLYFFIGRGQKIRNYRKRF